MKSTQLVVYHSILIKEEEILPAGSERFWLEIESGITANRAFCRTMLQELQETGLREVDDLLTLEPGYPSKVLHILTHMLDGFIGIDSVFYNLEEESHWLSESLRATIRQRPHHYWLVPVWHGTVTRSLLHVTQK